MLNQVLLLKNELERAERHTKNQRNLSPIIRDSLPLQYDRNSSI